jgi:8-oxo-dGTP diphosphatase
MPILVGIALVERDGRYLIRQRPPVPGSPMPGYWEFPGGKCEGGETPGEAAVRECGEETGMRVRLESRRRVVEHEYPHGRVELHYFDCRPDDPDADPDASSGFLWVPATDLPGLRFPEANEPILGDLARAMARAADGDGPRGSGFFWRDPR